jgi:glycosyltransferase involved in cell wall biosynthesis
MNYNFAIDATSIPNKPTGIGNYTIGLIYSLEKQIGNNKLFIFARDDQRILLNDAKSNIIYCGKLNTFKRLLWEQCMLPRLVKKYSIHLLHSPNYSIPLRASCKKVCTIHDLTSFLYPKRRKLIHGWFFRKMIRLSINHADMLISVSENTKKDIKDIFKKTVEIKTIYQGFNSIQYSDVQKSSPPAAPIDALIKNKYFLFVSTLEPSKNINRLIQSFMSFNNKNGNGYKLYLVGKLGWGYQDFLAEVNKPENDNIRYLGYQTNEQLYHLYKNALAFVYPSLYEGFGIPPLEAMACGLPVLFSNASSLPEVVEDAALLFDPCSKSEISDSMDTIANNPELRKTLIAKGYKQCSKFSWDKAAGEVLSAYYQILGVK